MEQHLTHETLIQTVLSLSEDNVRQGLGGPFAALVVKDGVIIGQGCNRVTAQHDPTAHAEMEAIRAACHYLGSHQLDGCVIYSSCEPCPMCLGGIYWARPDRLFYLNSQADAARIGFDDQFIYQELVRPVAQRQLTTEQLDHPRRLAAFELWQASSDREDY
ncbi:nucleoside deaminase [Alcanivorax sp.]|uniref:nucleoside deaminase n=1 Tax=Alcanivorax sp. TaxID=1872427 RepID=UPI00260CE524|nr:nucleoside deaminase [Alcanivorax sp.]